MSVREIKDATPKTRNHKKAPRTSRMQTETFRNHNLSEEHIAMLRDNIRKYREAHGGKAATRRGVPNGWGTKRLRKRRDRIIEAAKIKANNVIDKLIANGTLDKDGAGNEALKAATEIVLAVDAETEAHAYTVRDRLTAAKLVLEYTMSKPAEKKNVTVSAESFLSGLLDEDSKGA